VFTESDLSSGLYIVKDGEFLVTLFIDEIDLQKF
jgi:CRP-like cAMP-binding protein